ncbi:MAG TPA: transglycosylase family protein [Streptosporangiaceae bacterium]|jgi:LysM repeat protein|nr:transglycosylase family protein [Streptosporangiaceae bacterium]
MSQAATAAAAAPTLAGVAAAICLSPQSAQAATVPASHTAAQNAGHINTVPAAFRRTPAAAQLLADSRDAVKHKAASPASYKVHSGDTLSAIAGRFYHNPDAWPVIYKSNRDKIRWANQITPGEKLSIPAKPAHIPAAPKQLGPPAAHTTKYVPRHAASVTHSAPVTQTAGYYSGGGWPGGTFGACVVERESGGNPNIWNASGHYGLYQFSYATWVAYGGSAGEFGHASVGEQEQVFMNALARGGEDNWAPYDGC